MNNAFTFASHYGVTVFNRNMAGGHLLIVKGPKEIKPKIVKNYLSRPRGSVIVNFETLPHVFLPSYSRLNFKRLKMSSLHRDVAPPGIKQVDKASLTLYFYS